MPSVAGVKFDELKKNVQIKEIQGVKIPVLDLYGLLQTKQTVRPKDQADAKLIEHDRLWPGQGLLGHRSVRTGRQRDPRLGLAQIPGSSRRAGTRPK